MSMIYVQALLVLVKSKIKSYASTLLLYKKIQFYFSYVMQTYESYVKVPTPV